MPGSSGSIILAVRRYGSIVVRMAGSMWVLAPVLVVLSYCSSGSYGCSSSNGSSGCSSS